MTIQALIDELQQLPDKTLQVVVRGYEGGVDDIDCIEPIYIELNVNEEWYYGQHDVSFREDNEHKTQAIQLSGSNKLS